MAKEFTVELGGAEKVLKYTREERKDLERRFKKGLRELILQDVYPLDSENVPTGGGKYEEQLAFLHAGLRHGSKKLTEQKVEEWVDEAVQNGKHMLVFLTHAVRAAGASGVLGFVMNVEEDVEGKEPADAPQES